MTETTDLKLPILFDGIDDEIKFYCPKVFCENCRRDVEFIVHRTRRYGLYHGVRYRYKGKKANCKECGSTVYLPEILLYNMKKLAAEAQKQTRKEQENKDGI